MLGIYVAVSIGRGENRAAAVLDSLAGDAAVAVIGKRLGYSAIRCAYGAVVIIVGIRIGIRPQRAVVVYAGGYRGDVLVRVVAPRYVRNEVRPVRHDDARQAVHGVIAVVFGGEQGFSGYCAIFEREGLLLDFAYLPAGVISIRIANAAGIRKIRIPPQQIVRLGVVVILPPEAVAVQLLRQRPCAGIVVVRDQRPCVAYLYRRGKSGNAIREVVRRGGISARVRERREIIVRVHARNAAAVRTGNARLPPHRVVAVARYGVLRVCYGGYYGAIRVVRVGNGVPVAAGRGGEHVAVCGVGAVGADRRARVVLRPDRHARAVAVGVVPVIRLETRCGYRTGELVVIIALVLS